MATLRTVQTPCRSNTTCQNNHVCLFHHLSQQDYALYTAVEGAVRSKWSSYYYLMGVVDARGRARYRA